MPNGPEMPHKKLLFLCTGNYYRSRFAEILFNGEATKCGLKWRAFSRGLAPDPRNPGFMSRDTMQALEVIGIPYEEHLRYPHLVEEVDFLAADHVIAVKEAEHRPMIARGFSAWLDRVEFWQVHDLDCATPDETLAHLSWEVSALVERLTARREAEVGPP